MFNVYTNDQFDNLIGIGTAKTENDIFVLSSNYLKERGIYPHYYRMWKEPDGTTVIDYGSHTEFIYYHES